MTVTVKHSKTNAISDWTQAQLDEQIALGNFAEGTVLADIVLPSDWNDDHTLTGVGTMAEQNANSVAITGGSINGTTIGATIASTGKFTSVTTPSVTASSTDLTLSAISTGAVKLNTLNGPVLQAQDFGSANTNYFAFKGGNNAGSVQMYVAGTGSTEFWLSSLGTGAIRFQTNAGATEQMRITNTASAVNYVQVTGAATGSSPTISMQGSDSLIALGIRAKGNGDIFFQNNASAGTSLVLSGVTSGVNYHQLTNSAAGLAPTYRMVGTDTNISMAFQPKGTGAIDLAAGSSGVNISNGGTVTALTVTSNGTNYTSAPSVAITSPTTAGGVQATASVATFNNTGVSAVNFGGSGYTVGDTLTIVGGTPITIPATLTVAAVSAGVITSVTYGNFASYSALPTNPVSVTGGTGTGATFNIAWKVLTLSITNAGSGYIEQPTITFSGGGGSGAAAYASIGSTPTVRGLAPNLSFNNSNGEVLRLNDAGGTATGYIGLIPTTATSGGAHVFSSSNQLYISSNNGLGINFFTNGPGNTRQFFINHTASAVNFVQVTGAATTLAPVISAQGSDANIQLQVQSKGTGLVRFATGSGLQAYISDTASPVNQLVLTGGATTVAPKISVAGTDTNIDLSLTTKGTGAVRLNTGGGLQMQVADRASAVNYLQITGGAATQAAVFFTTQGTDTNIGYDMRGKGAGTYWFSTGSAFAPQMTITNTASAVNYVQVTGAATGVQPVISAQGSDANIALTLRSKGTFACEFGSSAGTVLFQAIPVASSVNYLQARPAIATASPSLTSAGTDTNIDLTLTPKGTGVVQFGTHTANADTAISGYITIRDAGGTLRKLAVIT